MSVHIDVKSESMSRTAASPALADVSSPRPRRKTLFENTEIVQKLTPELIAAIQAELEEQRLDYEARMDERFKDYLMIAAKERLELERLKLEAGDRWEEGTGSTAKSRDSKASP